MKCSMMTAMVNVKIASGEVVWKTKDFFFQIENVLKKIGNAMGKITVVIFQMKKTVQVRKNTLLV